jgi:hypothetical protein
LDLLRGVQSLAASSERPALDAPTHGLGNEESAAQPRAYRQQVVQALAELQPNPHVCGPFLYELVTQLAQDHAVAAQVSVAILGVGS